MLSARGYGGCVGGVDICILDGGRKWYVAMGKAAKVVVINLLEPATSASRWR